MATNKKYFKIRKIIFNIPHGLAVIFLGFLAIFIFYFRAQDFGFRIVNIKTFSMTPSIPSFTFIVTKSQKKYQVGDIITYKVISPKTNHEFSRTLTHRIIEEKEEGEKKVYIAKGDSNNYPDPFYIEEGDILGKVIFTLPYLGYFGVAIKTVPGFLIFIALPSFVLILNETRYLKKELKRLLTWS